MNDREKFGVVITQGGPGSENSMGGIAKHSATTFPSFTYPADQRSANTRSAPISHPCAPFRLFLNTARSLFKLIKLPMSCGGRSTIFATDVPVRS